MLIDTNILDKNKTYVGLEVGTGLIAYTLQELCHQVYKNIQVGDIPSHAFAILYNNVSNQWDIWENNINNKHNGIIQYALSEYETNAIINKVKKVYVYEYELDLITMKYWLNNNPGYSILNLAEITEKRLIHLPLPDTKGWVCSQSLAACNFKICLDMNLPFEVIAPVDFMFYLQNK